MECFRKMYDIREYLSNFKVKQFYGVVRLCNRHVKYEMLHLMVAFLVCKTHHGTDTNHAPSTRLLL